MTVTIRQVLAGRLIVWRWPNPANLCHLIMDRCSNRNIRWLSVLCCCFQVGLSPDASVVCVRIHASHFVDQIEVLGAANLIFLVHWIWTGYVYLSLHDFSDWRKWLTKGSACRLPSRNAEIHSDRTSASTRPIPAKIKTPIRLPSIARSSDRPRTIPKSKPTNPPIP